MKVYLDDVRQAPEGWRTCHWPDEVIALLKTGKVTDLSLDHDLGDTSPANQTGYDVLLWIEEAVVEGKFHLPNITIHSANPVAVKRMKQTLEVIKIRYDCIHNPQPDKYKKGD